MAVAVKNVPETSSRASWNRLAVASWVGAVYFLVAVAVVFYVIPTVWHHAVTPWLAHATNTFVNGALCILAMVTAAAGFIFVGTRLAGVSAPHGVRAGIFCGIVDLFLVGLLAQWIGIGLETLFYENRLLGASGPTVGMALTAVAGLALLIFGVQLFWRPSFDRWVTQVEDQGWFTAVPYKRSQGQRVRRGTMLGILVMVGCGVYTMLSHGSLAATGDWRAMIPFTGKVTLESLGDVPAALLVKNGAPAPSAAPQDQVATAWESLLQEGQTVTVDRFALRDLNDDALRGVVKVDDPGNSTFKPGQVVAKDAFEAEKSRLEEEGKQTPTSKPPVQAAGFLAYQTIPLLPGLVYTVPLLVALAGIWLAYRVVNYPTFADFLIATEAELNKVSWTTRRRLKQDTIVVLVTVILLTLFLFAADQLWAFTLNKIGVLQLNPNAQETTGPKEQPW